MWRNVALVVALQAGLSECAIAQSPPRLLVLPALLCGSGPGWAAAEQLHQRIWNSMDTTSYRRFDTDDARMVDGYGPCGGPQDSLAITDGDMLAFGKLVNATVLVNVRVLHPASGWTVEVGTFMPLQGEIGRRFDASSTHSYGEALDAVVPRVLEYLRGRGVRGFQIRPS